MASIEFLQNRVKGAEANIEKLNKKLERIRKVEAQNWEDPNPYYYSEYDLKSTLKELDQAQKSLESYKSKLQAETDKANSRNVQPILDFLEYWKCQVRRWYDAQLPKYLAARDEFYALDREHTAWYYNPSVKLPAEERKAKDAEYIKAKNKFRETWNFIVEYVSHIPGTSEYVINNEKLVKMLDREAELKYDDLVERATAVVGQITDASQLRVSAKGELNGIIIGTNGSAKIETIGAGGYNIMCFHYRTLIHKLS